jgi:hypothetical protein
MKKSNKILLGGFLTIILLIAGIHIALYAKYKTGHYTIYQPADKEQQTPMQSFPNVSIVTIRNCAADISFGDALSAETGKEKFIQYLRQGDSLVIMPMNNGEQFRNRGAIKIILPSSAILSAYDSELSFDSGKENENTDPNIFLYNSRAIFTFPGQQMQLGHIKVNASDNSTIRFHGNTRVGHLEVQLENSSLEESGGNFGQLSITTDSTSQLMLQSKHLLKAKITSIPNNP